MSIRQDLWDADQNAKEEVNEMISRLFVSLGLFALGYYVGREVGRTEAVREQMRQVREAGGSVNLREGVVIDMEPMVANEERQATKH
jgi:hypothetical protein